jgi:hypothetical protein
LPNRNQKKRTPSGVRYEGKETARVVSNVGSQLECSRLARRRRGLAPGIGAIAYRRRRAPPRRARRVSRAARRSLGACCASHHHIHFTSPPQIFPPKLSKQPHKRDLSTPSSSRLPPPPSSPPLHNYPYTPYTQPLTGEAYDDDGDSSNSDNRMVVSPSDVLSYDGDGNDDEISITMWLPMRDMGRAGTHSRGVSDWSHGPYRLPSIGVCDHTPY